MVVDNFKTKNMKVFKAKEGMWLTQSHVENEFERDFTTEVCTTDDTPDDFYRDATDEERQAWEERMNAMVEPVDEEYYDGV